MILAFALFVTFSSALSLDLSETLAQVNNTTTTDENGTFRFTGLSSGCYNLTAYRMVLGSMHFMGETSVNMTGDMDNVTISVARSDEAHYSSYCNATPVLNQGSFNLTGQVLGPNKPGGEPKEIPYAETQVKITAFSAQA